MGSDGVGKSTAIQSLLDGLDMPINSVARRIACDIRYGRQLRYEVEGSEIKPARMSSLGKIQGKLKIRTPLPILDDVCCIVSEVQQVHRDVRNDSLVSQIGMCDTVLYVMNACSAYTKNDAGIIGYLAKMKVPTFVVLSRCEILDAEEKAHVCQYLTDHLPESEYIHFNATSAGKLSENTVEWKDAIFAALQSDRGERINALEDAIKYDWLEMLKQKYTMAQKKEEDALSKVAEIRSKRESDLMKKDDEVARIINSVRDKEQVIRDEMEKVITGIVDETKDDIASDIGIASNIEQNKQVVLTRGLKKGFEKLRMRMYQVMNRHFISLINETKREFAQLKYNMDAIELPNIEPPHFDPETPETKDDEKKAINMQELTKLGLPAVALAVTAWLSGGAIVAGIAGISVMAARYVGDKISEAYSKKEKDALQKELPEILNDIFLQSSVQIIEQNHQLIGDFIRKVRDFTQECREKEVSDIEEKDKIAKHNCHAEIEKIDATIKEFLITYSN